MKLINLFNCLSLNTAWLLISHLRISRRSSSCSSWISNLFSSLDYNMWHNFQKGTLSCKYLRLNCSSFCHFLQEVNEIWCLRSLIIALPGYEIYWTKWWNDKQFIWTKLFCDQNYSTGNCPFSNIRLHTAKHLLFFYWLTVSYGWESAEILKSIINNYKSIDNWLKSAEVITPIKSINAGNSSHLMIKKASCHFHIVNYLLSHAWKVCLFE